MLEVLSESYEKDPYRYLERESLVRSTGLSMNEALRNMWYLDIKGLVEANWALGGHFSARISAARIVALGTRTRE
jgi:hypothetical protein